jgi:Cytochrome c oxidase assembly protein CtaG/Cox11
MKFAKLLGSLIAIGVLFLPSVYLLSAPSRGIDTAPLRTVNAYLKSAYAHDFKKAYRLISARDRMVKSEDLYIQEKGPFSGFTLAVAGQLAELIEISPLDAVHKDDITKIKFKIKLPDANSLAPLLLDWDQDRLNSLDEAKQKALLATIDELRRSGRLKIIEGEEELTLIKESGIWRILFDWAAGLRVRYDATVPQGKIIEATPLHPETKVRANELFTVAYQVKNLTDRTVATRIVHRVEPEAMRPHLDLVECALLIPIKLAAGESRQFTSTYMVRSDLPDGAQQVKVSYDFQIEK